MSERQEPNRAAVRALLDWYAASGVWSAESVTPSDLSSWPATGFRPSQKKRSAPPPPPAVRQSTQAPIASVSSSDSALTTDEAVTLATELARNADTIEALADAIEGFDGCPLKPGARKTVVYDGIAGAPLLIIGEAPGRDEDRIGKPFVGRAGGLLDKMLAAIGTSRTPDDGMADVCITNSIYWRPPGNREPTKAEVAICLPFVERFIALSDPRAIVVTGNVSTQALFPGAPGITRSRGKWRDWPGPGGRRIPVLPTFHPAFLLRQPGQKRLAWADLRSLAEALR